MYLFFVTETEISLNAGTHIHLKTVYNLLAVTAQVSTWVMTSYGFSHFWNLSFNVVVPTEVLFLGKVHVAWEP